MFHFGKGNLTLTFAGSALLAVVVGYTVQTAAVPAAQGDKKIDLTKAEFYGVSSCTKCHSGAGAFQTDLVYMDEVKRWRSKDKHALAFAALEGPRGQQMEKLLGFKVTDSAMCLNCHGASFRLESEKRDFTRKEGVGCTACHGPAQGWLTMHAIETEQWRSLTPDEKSDLGLYNVRDPLQRAALCLSCHVGNAAEGKVVTHAMYAAGHPPLSSFEVASQSLNMPPHWQKLSEVQCYQPNKTPSEKIRAAYQLDSKDYEQTKLVLGSNRAAMQAAARLIGDRSDFSSVGKGTEPFKTRSDWPPPWIHPMLKDDAATQWPELEIRKNVQWKQDEKLPEVWPEIMMTHAECYACHHELKSPSWRQAPRGYSGKKPGRPQFQEWPYSLAKTGLGDGIRPQFTAALDELYRACDQPFGNPQLVTKAAKNLDSCARLLPNPHVKGGAKGIVFDKAFATNLLKQLCTLPADYYPDYDSARQIAWAFNAVYNDQWNDKKDAAIVKILGELDDQLNLTLNSSVRRETTKLRDELGKTFDYGDPKVFQKYVVTLDNNKVLLQKLLAINERELVAAMDCASTYNPLVFRDRIAAIAAILKK